MSGPDAVPPDGAGIGMTLHSWRRAFAPAGP
jgi:hypothetical protein